MMNTVGKQTFDPLNTRMDMIKDKPDMFLVFYNPDTLPRPAVPNSSSSIPRPGDNKILVYCYTTDLKINNTTNIN